MTLDFWIALLSWLLAPLGQAHGKHARCRYVSRHRLDETAVSRRERLWLLQHRADFAIAYARARQQELRAMHERLTAVKEA